MEVSGCYEQILSQQTHQWRGAAEGNLKAKSKSGLGIFLNNLQAGKVSKFITKLIVRNRDRKEKLVWNQRMYCSWNLRKSMSFIIVIHPYEKLKAFLLEMKSFFAELLTEAS